MFLPHVNIADSVFMFNPYGLDTRKFETCKVAMVQRLSSQSNYQAIKIIKEQKLKLVYDLDDDLWAVPIYNPAYRAMKEWLPGFEICARMADLITVSTAHLKVAVLRALGKHCPRVEVVENSIDYRWFRPLPEELRKNKNGTVTVGWAGTNTHTGDTKQVFSLIPGLMRKLPQMNFEMAGAEIPKDWIDEFGTRVKQRDFIPVAEFATNWSSWQWDISLAPLEDNSFNKSKSSIKMLEASAVKIPCVVSDVGEYSKFASTSPLLRRSTLCRNESAWNKNITNLVEDADFRKLVGDEMYRVGRQRFDIVERVEVWKRLFAEVVDA
jgi:glycosyltransferase involved in cell wall biosynthesis